MEVHPGVFVSNVATEEWQADPEIGGGAEEHLLFDSGTMRAGLSRFTNAADQQPPDWALPATQVLLVLEQGDVGARRVTGGSSERPASGSRFRVISTTRGASDAAQA